MIVNSCSRFLLGLVTSVMAAAFAVSASASSGDPQYHIYVTSKVVHQQPDIKPMNVFDCNDRIYLVVEALNLEDSNHDLVVQWIDPSGKQEEKTDYSFPNQPFVRVWAWLQLRGPTGAAIGQVIDPSFGMERFIGSWNAKVNLDGRKIQDVPFDVIC